MPALAVVFSVALTDDPEADADSVKSYVEQCDAKKSNDIIMQLDQLMGYATTAPEELLSELGAEANRWFSDVDEARGWILQLKELFLVGVHSADVSLDLIVKDSNGARLLEGDSVTVIKDLKVKGGSSDLKRGTLVKKIHLIDDPEAIECRVEGSTLVLKTCFLKKA